jgi:hypothetical protein
LSLDDLFPPSHTDAPAGTPVCAAPQCGRVLRPSQVRHKAKACSVRCRVRLHKQKKKNALLDEVDAMGARLIAIMAKLRQKIERAP